MRISVRCFDGRSLGAMRVLGLGLAAGAPDALAQQNFTLGYSTGFLQDPFQVVQADSVIAAASSVPQILFFTYVSYVARAFRRPAVPPPVA